MAAILAAESCCYNYVQAGLVIYKDDDNFIKLASVSIWETRQTEYAKEQAPVPDGYPRYGNSVIGPPDEWTWAGQGSRRSLTTCARNGSTRRRIRIRKGFQGYKVMR